MTIWNSGSRLTLIVFLIALAVVAIFAAFNGFDPNHVPNPCVVE